MNIVVVCKHWTWDRLGKDDREERVKEVPVRAISDRLNHADRSLSGNIIFCANHYVQTGTTGTKLETLIVTRLGKN